MLSSRWTPKGVGAPSWSTAGSRAWSSPWAATSTPSTSAPFPPHRGSDEGSATLSALALLILVTALTGGLAALSLTGADSRADRTAQAAERARALATALAVMTSVANGQPEVPAGATLSDASSAVNPNWITQSLLAETPLKNWLLKGRTPTAFLQDRADHGLATDLVARWKDWFRVDLLESRMTSWGPWPVNVADEVALEQAFVLRTGDKAAAVRFRDGVRRARVDRKPLSDEQIRGLAGPYADAMDVFTAAAPWNANTLPEDQLRALLSSPALGIASPDTAANRVVDARRAAPLTADALNAALGVTAVHPVRSYLGVETAVWQVRIKAGREELWSWWSRVPGSDDYRPAAREWREAS